MLSTGTFSHTGVNGTHAGQRMAAEGYSGSWGENIVWQAYAGAAPTQTTVDMEATWLFKSPSHRTNLLNDYWDVTGIGMGNGTYQGNKVNMGTHDFGRTSPFQITGVAYSDNDGDKGYDIGEGKGGIAISFRSASGVTSSTTSMSAGGYMKELAAGTYTVTFGGTDSATVMLGSQNVKLDFEGGDTLLTSASATIGGAMQHARLLGTDAINLTGTTGANILTGNAGANRLLGGAGNDTIDGGAGTDTAAFGGLRAQYTITKSGSVVTVKGVDGTDTLTNVEKLAFADKVIDSGTLATTSGTTTTSTTTTTTTSPNGVASDTSGTITGTSANNTLVGSAGNDTIDGLGGADRMEGRAGNDTYILDHNGDVVVEAAGAGTDTIRTAVTHIMEANVENLVLTGTGSYTVTGNGLGNRMDGNSGRNQLIGGGGNDTLWGGGGTDSLTGGAGNDMFVFKNTGERVTVKDFTNGLDKIDLSVVLDTVGYGGTNPLSDGHVKLTAITGGTTIAIDKDGPGGVAPVVIAALDKVGVSLLDASDFRF